MEEMTIEFVKNKLLKSFVRVGNTFVDLKQTIGFSFLRDEERYIIAQFVYESGRALNAFITDRNEFAQFLLQLDPFIDDIHAMSSIEDFIIETEKNLGITKSKKKRSKK